MAAPLPPGKKQRVVNLAKLGLCRKEIARRLGLNYGAVVGILARNGMQTHKRGS